MKSLSVATVHKGAFLLNGVVILPKILDSDNLKECVDIILSKERTITSTEASVASEIALYSKLISSGTIMVEAYPRDTANAILSNDTI